LGAVAALRDVVLAPPSWSPHCSSLWSSLALWALSQVPPELIEVFRRFGPADIPAVLRAAPRLRHAPAMKKKQKQAVEKNNKNKRKAWPLVERVQRIFHLLRETPAPGSPARRAPRHMRPLGRLQQLNSLVRHALRQKKCQNKAKKVTKRYTKKSQSPKKCQN
jgi:hypothetical protein